MEIVLIKSYKEVTEDNATKKSEGTSEKSSRKKRKS
jgi:hypothetical protein